MGLSLTPAYGRDYKSKKAVLADFNDNKDFVAQPQGSYINKQDIENSGGGSVSIRYQRITKQIYVHVDPS